MLIPSACRGAEQTNGHSAASLPFRLPAVLYKCRVRQKECLLWCGQQSNNMGAIIYSFNLNISPKMLSYGVLECYIEMLQN